MAIDPYSDDIPISQHIKNFDNVRGSFQKIEKDQRLLTYSGEDEVISAARLKERLDREPRPVWSARSKIPMLDKLIGGAFRPGQLVVTSGTTGHGKTTLYKTFTQSFIEQDIPLLWLTFEIGADDLIDSIPDIYRDHFYLPAKLTSKELTWIEDRTLEAILKYKVKAIFIDHLHRIVDLTKIQNSSLAIGATVQSLKLMAVKHGVIVFLIAHTTKTKSDAELGLGDIRDSSLIEQESDIVLYTWRGKKDLQSFLKIAKNRPKGIIDKKTELIFRDGRYFEVDGITRQ